MMMHAFPTSMHGRLISLITALGWSLIRGSSHQWRIRPRYGDLRCLEHFSPDSTSLHPYVLPARYVCRDYVHVLSHLPPVSKTTSRVSNTTETRGTMTSADCEHRAMFYEKMGGGHGVKQPQRRNSPSRSVAQEHGADSPSPGRSDGGVCGLGSSCHDRKLYRLSLPSTYLQALNLALRDTLDK